MNGPGFFKVTFTGLDQADAQGNEAESADFYLADYRFVNNELDYIVLNWNLVDLSALGPARSLGIVFESPDVGDFGTKTPTYVAIDQIFFRRFPSQVRSGWDSR